MGMRFYYGFALNFLPFIIRSVVRAQQRYAFSAFLFNQIIAGLIQQPQSYRFDGEDDEFIDDRRVW